MRARVVRWVAFCIKHWPKIKRFGIRLASLVGGLLILKREIYDVDHPEPLLIFLGLWLCGIAPAQFFDGLKKIGQEAKGDLEKAADGAPAAPKPELPSADTRPQERS